MNEVRLYARKKVLYLDYVENGRRIRKSLKIEATKANEAYAIRNIMPEYERKLKNRISTTENFKLSEFIQKVLKDALSNKKLSTYMAYRAHSERFLEVMGDKSVSEYKVMDIERYCDIVGGAAFSSKLAPISLAFDAAMRYELILRNPVKLAKKPKSKPAVKEPFSYGVMRQILDAAQGELKTFLCIAFYTGARAGEVLALRPCDINETHVFITRTMLRSGVFNSPKNGKARQVILLDPLKRYLSGLNFGIKDHQKPIISLCYATLSAQFKKLQKEIGLRPQSLHVTRHTFASMLMNAQIRPMLVQNLLGHQDLSMTAHYSHFMENELDKNNLELVFNVS
nr:MAG TPA: Integrase [Caudoviricetes sp.]